MAMKLHWIGQVSLAFGILTMASAGHAQAPRPWVDPPSEAGTSTSRPSATAAPKPATPQPSPPPVAGDTAAKADVPDKKQTLQRTEEVASSAEKSKPVLKRKARKTASERKNRTTKTQTAVRPEPQPRPRTLADRSPVPTRAERVREGINAGLEVMTLRTIEFPDGRRVQILTRPQPESMSRLMEIPE